MTDLCALLKESVRKCLNLNPCCCWMLLNHLSVVFLFDSAESFLDTAEKYPLVE